jgi:putative aldouronate transport system permease protein
MVIFCITILFPLWDMVVISLSRVQDVSSLRMNLFPSKVIVDSYQYCFRNKEFLGALFISVSRTVVGTVYHVLVVTMAAYCLTRMKMPFRKTITVIFVITMFFNGGLIPTYINIRNLKLLNNFFVYIIPTSFSMFTVIIVRNFFFAIDDALEEAAVIDGATPLQVLFRIMLPLSKPVLATIALWRMVMQWNSWFDNLIYNSAPALLTLQLLLRRIIVEPQLTELNIAYEQTGGGGDLNPETIKAATTVLVTLPIVCVYPFLQKYFVKGIMLGSVKG